MEGKRSCHPYLGSGRKRFYLSKQGGYRPFDRSARWNNNRKTFYKQGNLEEKVDNTHQDVDSIESPSSDFEAGSEAFVDCSVGPAPSVELTAPNRSQFYHLHDHIENDQHCSKESTPVLSELFLICCLECDMAYTHMEKLWNFIKDHKDLISSTAFNRSFRTIFRNAEKETIPVHVEYGVLDKDNKIQHHVNATKQTVDDDKKLAYEMSFVEIDDALDLHKSSHPNCEPVVVLANDGVQESNSKKTSLDVFALRFEDCDEPYPLLIYKTLIPKFSLSEEEVLKKAVELLKKSSVQVRLIIADAPKRARLKRVRHHNAKCGCDVCTAEAKRIKLESGSGKSAWPISTFGGPLRTKERLRELGENFADGREEKEGVLGVSELFEIPNFDPISQIPPEIMHLGCLGVSKRLLTIATDKKAKMTGIRPLSEDLLTELNEKLEKVKVPSETPRRPRAVCLATYKASEYLIISTLLFPIVIDVHLADQIHNRKKEARAWQLFACLMRLAVMTEEECETLNEEAFQVLLMKFYRSYQLAFGLEQMPYNIHVFASHLDKIIEWCQKTLHDSSFPFEGMFANMKRSYQAGTRNVSKQIVRNMYMKRRLKTKYKHRCRKRMVLKPGQTKTTRDDLVYKHENGEYIFYKILAISDSVCSVHKIETQISDTIIPELKNTGVLLYSHNSSEIEKKDLNWFTGKASRVDTYLVTVPSSVLTEI